MHIILLSGGSGKRLWPLSNGTRSKQFLKLLTGPYGVEESMVQRMTRQISEVCPGAEVVLATASSQQDPVRSQLGQNVEVVTEPSRRGTFPAIALATEYLSRQKNISDDEVIVVMPCDTYTEAGYFRAIRTMAEEAAKGESPLILMGIPPTEASAKFGYILPRTTDRTKVERFTEKPSLQQAESLLAEGAVWNGGAFAFRLGFMRNITEKYIKADTYEDVRRQFESLPKISFDCEVAETTPGSSVVYYTGPWKDLGTWASLANEIGHNTIGNAIENGCTDTTAINELNIPLICHGTSNLIVAASPDGILVADKSRSHTIKQAVGSLDARPMYEERRWGTYKVIDNVEFPDGYCALTKQLTLNPGCSISYQRHNCREEVWTFIDGEGEIVLDGERKPIKRGDTVTIPMRQLHALRALTPLTFIEVQRGSNLVEEDIERFPYEW